MFNEQKVFDLLDVKDSSVIEMKNNKLYLNLERLVVTPEGLFLQSDFDGFVKIPFVSVDGQGVYTLASNLSNVFAAVYPVIKCRNCQRPFSPNIFNMGVCPNCGYQN